MDKLTRKIDKTLEETLHDKRTSRRKDDKLH